jgi:S-DNA-T family DNA segregation ATPase FtsK/SpoIIIE
VTSCLFPQHHKSGGGSTGPATAIVIVVLLVALWLWSHLAELVHWAVLVALVLGAAAALFLAVRLAIRRRPKVVEQPGPSHPRSASRPMPWLRHLPRALWAAARWHHLTHNLGLAYADKHRPGKVRRPRAIVRADAHGVVARVRTVPGSGRAEFDKAAEHIANYWRVARVSVAQPKPGRLIVRGLRRDPLLEVLGAGDIPVGRDLRHLYLGRDEHGTHRFADLANVPGICLGGMPGSGKSTEITSWLTQLAPSPAVQFALADGKNAGEFDDFSGRAYAMAGDDLDQVIDLLEKQHALMTDRLAAVRLVLGVKNAWHVGPTEAWPLAVTVLDECQSFLDLTAVKGDKQLEAKVRRCIFLTSSLIRRGRSVMMLTIPATQKPTTDSLPSSIRDNCPISLCFGVKTIDAAAATLGTEIRRYDSYSPVTLADPAYAGCCTVTLKTGQDPFTRLRGSYVTEDQAAAVAAASAHLRRDPRASVPIVVPDDASSLDPTSAGA